jgi:hypothetical protein
MTGAPVRDPDGRRVLAPATIVRGDRLLTLDYGDPATRGGPVRGGASARGWPRR